MIRLHTLIAALLIMSLLLTACGGQQQTVENAPESVEAPAIDAPTDAPAIEEPTAVDEAVAEATATFDETALDLEGFPPLSGPSKLFDILERTEDAVTVEHAYGELTIPSNPQRVVAAYEAAEALIALGIMPTAYPGWTDVPEVLKEQAPDIEWIQIVDEGPNLEELAAFEPDLIIDTQSWMGANGESDNYEVVNEIAPTLVFYTRPGYWQELVLQLGELFDRTEQAEAVIADYNQQIVPLRERVKAVIGDETVAPIKVYGETDVILYGPSFTNEGSTYPGLETVWLYRELQLTPGPEVREVFGKGGPSTDSYWFPVPQEFLPELQADHLVVFPDGGLVETIDEAEGYLGLTEQPIWKALPAVHADNVHEMLGVARNALGYYTLLEAMNAFADAVEE
ncbi:MAG: ABC transporter substrate-binding protein [Cyanobacteria bacterium P01_G01_bin.4]